VEEDGISFFGGKWLRPRVHIGVRYTYHLLRIY